MSRTLKDEHKTDGWNVGRRLERQARSAGRMRAILEAEAECDGHDGEHEELFAEWEQSLIFEDDPWDLDGYTSPCGCHCRRCLLHGDCGGCVADDGERTHA